MENIGDRIKNLRYKKGFTLKEVANELGLTKTAIVKYENGEVKNIKYENIEKLANLFEVSPDFLINGESEDIKNLFVDTIIKKTLENKIEWSNIDYYKKDSKKVILNSIEYNYEDLLNLLDGYKPNCFHDIKLAVSKSHILFFIVNYEGELYTLLYGDGKNMNAMYDNNLDSRDVDLKDLYELLFAPEYFLDRKQMEAIITDLNNL